MVSKKDVSALLDLARDLGCTIDDAKDGGGHWVCRHPNGEVTRIAATPSRYTSITNSKAELRRKSDQEAPRAKAGHYKKGVEGSRTRRHDAEIGDAETSTAVSQATHAARLREAHDRLLRSLVDARLDDESQDGHAVAVRRLLNLRAELLDLGVHLPPLPFPGSAGF